MDQKDFKPEKCPNCKLFKSICVCSEIKIFDLKTRITILMHTKEVERTTNTGKLARLILKNSKTILIGMYNSPPARDDIFCLGYENLILFPSANNVLDKDFIIQLDKPVNLIVPDGNYHQAGKMFRSDLLKNFKRVRLPDGQNGVYGLRDSKDRQKISTIEAIIKAVEIVENGPAVVEMQRVFLKMVSGFKSKLGKN